MLKYDYVNRTLRRIFYQFGGLVAIYPYYFIFIPIAIFLVLASGFFRLTVRSEVDYLYVPTNSRALKERYAVERLFPNEKGRADILRITREGPSVSVIIEAKDGRSVFRNNIFERIRQVDDVINNVTVVWNGNIFKYKDLCSLTSDNVCFRNDVMDLQWKINELQKRTICLKYPIDNNKGIFSWTIYAIWLGGVTTDKNNCIEDAKAIRLLYYLSEYTLDRKEVSLKWEEAFHQTMSETFVEDIHIYRAFSSMLDRDGSKFTKLIIPIMCVAFPVMLTFAVASCFTSDWVTSKPWVGIAAFISPLVSTVGAFGLLLLCGMEYTEFNVAIPLLMLAIGLDDSFVLLSVWRHTDPGKSVEQRMRETYSDAAVSITVTSVTNLISFFVGITTPYRIHKMFFIYGSLTVVMAYVSEITFFGGILALTGYREAKNLHPLFFVPVKQRTNHGKNVEDVGQIVSSCAEEDEPRKRKELVTFYRDKLGVLLSKFWIKIITVLFYFIFLSGGLYGLTSLKEGLNIRMVFPPTSYAFKYITKQYEFFSEYPHVIQIVINKPLDYSDPLIQKDVEDILNKFATADNMGGTDLIESWLKFYLESKEDLRLWLSYRSYNISKKDDFIAALNTVFLKLQPFSKFNKDIIFNENKTEIIATRFILISNNISNGYEEAGFIKHLWEIADSCKYPVHVHNFRFVTQSLASEIKDVCIRTILASTALAIAVFMLTVPHPTCILLVGVAIASIQVSVLGYMALWDVGIDIVSSTALVISTGLSVDYLAHVSYAYIISQKKNPNENLRAALHSAGHPVFQGCVSTILLVCTFPVGSVYAFVVLFKIIFLLMLFAGFIALFVLPVCLTFSETLLQVVRGKKLDNGETATDHAPEASSLMNASKNGITKNEKIVKKRNI